MNDELDKNSLRFLFYRYKDSLYVQLLIIVLVLVVCSNLFFRIVIPQIEGWFSIREEIIATRERIDVMNQNVRFLDNLDKQRVVEQYSLATAALPFEKDFGAIIAALTDASVQSGVSLQDFTFQVGEIASASAQQTPVKDPVSSVDVTVFIDGDIYGVNRFLQQINQTLPLAEVTEINGDSFSTSLTIKFYQKQFPALTVQDDKPVSDISQQDESLLNDFVTWKPITSEAVTPVSSESGFLIPLF